MSADASRRFLIVAGTEHYEGGDELASVPEDLRKMAGFFGRLGYCEQLPEIRRDPSSSALRQALSEWLNGSGRQASDTAVIYYSGHGDSQASYFTCLPPIARRTATPIPRCAPTLCSKRSAKSPRCDAFC